MLPHSNNLTLICSEVGFLIDPIHMTVVKWIVCEMEIAFRQLTVCPTNQPSPPHPCHKCIVFYGLLFFLSELVGGGREQVSNSYEAYKSSFKIDFCSSSCELGMTVCQ